MHGLDTVLDEDAGAEYDENIVGYGNSGDADEDAGAEGDVDGFGVSPFLVYPL